VSKYDFNQGYSYQTLRAAGVMEMASIIKQFIILISDPNHYHLAILRRNNKKINNILAGRKKSSIAATNARYWTRF
jgi:hypothetical protein